MTFKTGNIYRADAHSFQNIKSSIDLLIKYVHLLFKISMFLFQDSEKYLLIEWMLLRTQHSFQAIRMIFPFLYIIRIIILYIGIHGWIRRCECRVFILEHRYLLLCLLCIRGICLLISRIKIIWKFMSFLKYIWGKKRIEIVLRILL
jgi:hypothetical protein